MRIRKGDPADAAIFRIRKIFRTSQATDPIRTAPRIVATSQPGKQHSEGGLYHAEEGDAVNLPT